jgi:hypothetical protein
MKIYNWFIKMIKKIFSLIFATKPHKNITNTTPPGRTFKRILTGEYFGYKEYTDKDPQSCLNEKQHKINKIKELGLDPKYIRYTYQKATGGSQFIKYAYVSFQKEVLAEKWNMLHITDISFIVYANDFHEFEEMANVSLEKDFQILDSTTQNYQGKERRQQPRNY